MHHFVYRNNELCCENVPLRKIAEKVVLGRVDLDHDMVKRSILNAFETIPEPAEVTLNINPDDYEYIELMKEDIFRQMNEIKNISVVSDPAVSRGGCKIETRSGNVDASLESRLDAVKDSILKANGNRI